MVYQQYGQASLIYIRKAWIEVYCIFPVKFVILSPTCIFICQMPL